MPVIGVTNELRYSFCLPAAAAGTAEFGSYKTRGATSPSSTSACTLNLDEQEERMVIVQHHSQNNLH